MTLPDEWFISLRKNRNFLFDLLNPEITPKIPKEIRKRASECLKHFPMTPDIDQLETMYKNSTEDKNILIGRLNKELQRISGELTIANSNLNHVAAGLQEFINKPENKNG